MSDTGWEQQRDGRWEVDGGWDTEDDRTPVGPGLMEYREVIRNQLIENGYGDLIKLKDAYREIDTAEMKRVAHELYGTTDDFVYGRALDFIEKTSGKNMGQLQGNCSGELFNIGHRVVEVGNDTLTPNWRGRAFMAFQDYEARLRGVTVLEARRLALIGKELFNVADAIEIANRESENVLLGAASLLLTISGLATAATPGAILLAAAGALQFELSKAEQQMDERNRKIEELDLATIDLNSPVIAELDPHQLMLRFPENPSDLEEWRALPLWRDR